MPDFDFLAHPYQAPSPIQTMGQLYALQGARQEMAQRDQAMRMNDLDYRVAQRKYDDQVTLGQAYKDAFQQQQPSGSDGTQQPQGGAPAGPPQFDEGKFLSSVASAAPHLLPSAMGTVMDQRKARLTYQGELLAAAQKHTDYLGQHFQGISDAPPDQKQTVYAQSRAQMIADGVLQPGSPDDPGALYPGDDAIGRLQQQTMTVKDGLAAHAKQLEVALTQQQRVEEARHNAATEAQGQATLAQTTRRDAQQAAYQRGELGIRGGQLALDRQKVGLEYGTSGAGNGLQGTDFLRTLDPAVALQVKSVANGDIPMPRNSGPGIAVNRAVLQYDPSYTEARFTSKQSFKTGADSTTLQNLATTLGHLENLKSTSNSLGTAPLLGTRIQSAADNGLTAALTGASGEIGKLITGGVVPEGELNALKENMTSASPVKRAAAIDKFTDLIKDRFAGISQKYKTATGQDLPPGEFFDKPTQQRLTKFGMAGGAPDQAPVPSAQISSAPIEVVAPNGRVYHFNSSSDAVAFKTKAGIR